VPSFEPPTESQALVLVTERVSYNRETPRGGRADYNRKKLLDLRRWSGIPNSTRKVRGPGRGGVGGGSTPSDDH